MEIRQIGAYLFHVNDRTEGEGIEAQTDMAKPIVPFTILRRHLKMYV
jgi:hypothetical protein